jgi:hypothetical protein
MTSFLAQNFTDKNDKSMLVSDTFKCMFSGEENQLQQTFVGH